MSKTIPESHIDILELPCFGHVATLRPDGLLSVHPVSVMYTDGTVWFSTLKTRKKVRNLERDDRMSLSIPHPDNPVHYIELRGRGVIKPDPERQYVNAMAKKFMGVEEYPYDKPGDERVVVEMVVEQVSTPLIPKPEGD